MRKSPLIELLEAFTPEELAEFQLFVQSPYFNRGEFCEEAPLLLRVLVEDASEWRWDEEARRAAFAAVFPDTPFIDGKLEKVMSVLHRLARLFVSIHSRVGEPDDFEQMLDLARFSRRRALHNRFQNTMQKLRLRFSSENAEQDIQFYTRQFHLEWEQYEFENLFNHKRGDINIPGTLEALNQHFHSLKTDLLNRFLLQQKVTHLDISEPMQTMLKEAVLPQRLIEKSALLRLESAFLQVLELEKPDKDQFQALVSLIRDSEKDIKPDFLKDYYSLLRSCCILLVNSGNMQYLPTLFEIQKEHLQRGYLYYDQKIPAAMFQNIINVALRVGEYDWAYHCIQTHADRIIGDNDQQDYFRLNLANYFFHIGRYDDALSTLPHSLEDLEYQFTARSLELKILYEQDSELLPYKIDAFKMYLSRASGKLLPMVSKDRNGNFVNLLFQLCNTLRGDGTRVQRLLTRIQAKTWVAHREWLLEKATELL